MQGFPEQPLMEDLVFSKRLRALGRVEILTASVRVSGRRFLAHPIRYFALTNIFPLLYRCGWARNRRPETRTDAVKISTRPSARSRLENTRSSIRGCSGNPCSLWKISFRTKIAWSPYGKRE